MKTAHWFLIPALALAAALPGCGSDPPTTVDAGGTEAGPDVPVVDTPVVDRADVTQPDAPTDMPPADAPADVPPADAPADVPPADAPADVPPIDAPADVPPVDAPADAPVDVRADAPADSPGDTTPADVPDAGSVETFSATLQGAQEVPAVYNTTATGSATFTLGADRSRLSYTITHTLATVTGAHFHLGIAGEAGGIEVTLTPGASPMTGVASLTPTQVAALEAGQLYLNLHTAAHAGGELRGQVVAPGERVWVARLTGEQESPPIAGTTPGLAQILLAETNESIRYIVRSPVLPTAAHIHTGPGGVAGGITVTLSGAVPAMTMTGTVAVMPAAVMADLFQGRWYVNVHTTAQPGGALRGQVLRPGEVLYTGTLNGANESPVNASTATGVLAAILSNDHQRLTYEGALTGLTPNAAHLHRGATGVNGPVDVTLMLIGSSTLRGIGDVPTDTDAFITALDAAGIYANVHSSTFPGGEIRGQLRRQ